MTPTLLRLQQAGLSDGWEQIPATLTYASATTINTSIDLTGILQKGDKIKLNNTTTKYFYVVSLTSTVITVTGGSDYSVANAAITSPFFSKVANPQGFPAYFNLAAPSYDTGTVDNGTGGQQPATQAANAYGGFTTSGTKGTQSGNLMYAT